MTPRRQILCATLAFYLWLGLGTYGLVRLAQPRLLGTGAAVILVDETGQLLA